MQLNKANKIIINVDKENWKLDTVELSYKSAFGRQRQADHYKFKTNLVHILSSSQTRLHSNTLLQKNKF